MKTAAAMAMLILTLALPALAAGGTLSRLEVEVTAQEQVRLVAQQVTYGDLLRVLERRLGVPIKMAESVERSPLDFIQVEAASPEQALAELLRPSGFGYAIFFEPSGRRMRRVVVFSESEPAEKERLLADTASDAHPQPITESNLAEPAPGTSETAEGDAGEALVPGAERRPLEEAAAEVLGLPPGLAAQAVVLRVEKLPAESRLQTHKLDSQTITRPLAEAAEVMGTRPEAPDKPQQ